MPTTPLSPKDDTFVKRVGKNAYSITRFLSITFLIAVGVIFFGDIYNSAFEDSTVKKVFEKDPRLITCTLARKTITLDDSWSCRFNYFVKDNSAIAIKYCTVSKP